VNVVQPLTSALGAVAELEFMVRLAGSDGLIICHYRPFHGLLDSLTPVSYTAITKPVKNVTDISQIANVTTVVDLFDVVGWKNIIGFGYNALPSSMSLTYMSSSADCRTERSIKAQFFSEMFCSSEAMRETSEVVKT